MKCPWCNHDMELGSIQKDRYSLKWVSDKNDQGLLNFTMFVDGIKLIPKGNKSKIKVFYCYGCKKFIIDQNNL